MDDDEIKTNPAFIPKSGQFYQHDLRTGNEPDAVEAPQEEAKTERQSRADVNKWTHDLYNEQRQQPKIKHETSNVYGHNSQSKESTGDEEVGEQQQQESRPPKPQRTRRFDPNYSNRRRQHNHDERPSARQGSRNSEDQHDRSDEAPYQRRQNNFRQRGDSVF